MFIWKKPRNSLLFIVLLMGSSIFPIVSLAQNGTQKWAFVTGDDVVSSPAVALDGTIYVDSWDNKLGHPLFPSVYYIRSALR